jgi:hypothetical protein
MPISCTYRIGGWVDLRDSVSVVEKNTLITLPGFEPPDSSLVQAMA